MTAAGEKEMASKCRNKTMIIRHLLKYSENTMAVSISSLRSGVVSTSLNVGGSI